ncbi:MAG TPA: hypothetical protein PLV88_06120 [Methanoregulaceae archaeon]|nr:hypothetical protein [Methanoregulaceae archaeon]HNI41843.1 hypothetical protein [Methanoregulaceae archaeon]HNJ80496.1 hypothetical protein [Methanoregulaceae archaeon]HNL85803.1 hypothetical protein [Methanoregulaceae archaeon]HNO07838.1 hypothetical protein [Methanoregulaceae archaeon]
MTMNSRLLVPLLLSLAFPLVLVVLLHSGISPGSTPYVIGEIALILLFFSDSPPLRIYYR